ncbi:MAG: hypothetical protein U1F71_23620 [Verrucomicrobiaceae bacterium]
MSLLRKRILPTLAVLVVACAQVFGMQRGFVCDHQGTVVETQAEHCHRVMAEDHDDYVPCSHGCDKECGEQEDTEHHAPLAVDLQTSTAGLAAVSIPSFVAVMVVEIPVHEWVLIQTLTENEMLKVPPDTGDESPPAALQVARCMVILV